ncbi:MAG: alpha/beta hydrolase [Actinomycetota bacterium]
MGTAAVNGIEIDYEDSGGDGPAVLFSHGFLMDHTMFDRQVEALAPDYRCIRWDERGFGGTVAPAEFSYWDSATDAVALLDHLGIDRAVFVGMSQGGFLSIRAALAAPDRVAGLVLIDSAADVDDEETIGGYQQMLQGMQHGTDEDRAGIFAVVSGLILGDEALAAEWIPKWDARDPDQLVLAGGALLGRDDVSDRLGEIACPALVVHGTADQAITIDRAEAACAGLPDCRGLVKVEGAAHAPNMTHAEVVNPPLREFLDAVTA